ARKYGREGRSSMPRVLLDTNVFIFSIEHPKSNSSIIMEMAIDGEIEVVISEEIKLEFVEKLGIEPFESGY
ncbi:MAG: PIN domain-containing protein, partial [Candidatus Hydrothermarchaeota archaeon]|nr:PIN domain-containing protein [Candidatus Hydrothermarchaeota archaeon]